MMPANDNGQLAAVVGAFLVGLLFRFKGGRGKRRAAVNPFKEKKRRPRRIH